MIDMIGHMGGNWGSVMCSERKRRHSGHFYLETHRWKPQGLLFELSDPEVVLSAVVQDGQQRHVFALLQRVWVGGDGPYLRHLKHKQQSSTEYLYLNYPNWDTLNVFLLVVHWTNPGLSAYLQAVLEAQLVLLRGCDGPDGRKASTVIQHSSQEHICWTPIIQD